MGIVNIKDMLKENKLKHIIIFVISFFVIYSTLLTSIATKKYTLKEGEIAKTNIKAQREFKDEISTEARIRDAENSVQPQYAKKTEIKDTAVDHINNLFVELVKLKDLNSDEKDKISKLKGSTDIALSDDDISYLLKLSKDELKSLQDFIVSTLSEIYDNSIEYNPEVSKEINDEKLKRAQETVLLKFNSSKFSKAIRDIGTTVANSQIKPNSIYDKDKTEELKKEAIKKVSPVMIKKDQIIVKEGEPVTKYQLELLKTIGLLNNGGPSEWYLYVSLAVFVAFILIVESYYLFRYHNELYWDLKKYMMINLLSCISVILARVLSLASPFLIPFACIPMLMTLLLDHKISLAISVINTLLISAAMGFKIETTLLAVINAVMGAIILRKMQQRNDILYACLSISLINLITSFSIGFLLSNNALDILKNAIFSVVSSCLSGVLTIGFLPFFESTFDIVTTIKLLELSNPNNPLLKKLLMEAPGTYHHSVIVANLAEVAAEEVGGNPVLARVSSYYHDIGKIKRPFFFKENQLNGDNPHNKITPNLSALIITSHVKDGLELAKDFKVPRIIRDVIEQHHGDSLVKYFYITAKNSSDNPESINEEDFRYPGPIPYSKEAGIVMLADSIEASVRSINEPTSEKIEVMVDSIFKDKLAEGQLDNCDLTLKDLDKIKKAFLKSLSGIYHQRIEYPTDKWAKKQNEEIKE